MKNLKNKGWDKIPEREENDEEDKKRQQKRPYNNNNQNKNFGKPKYANNNNNEQNEDKDVEHEDEEEGFQEIGKEREKFHNQGQGQQYSKRPQYYDNNYENRGGGYKKPYSNRETEKDVWNSVTKPEGEGETELQGSHHGGHNDQQQQQHYKKRYSNRKHYDQNWEAEPYQEEQFKEVPEVKPQPTTIEFKMKGGSLSALLNKKK